MGTQKKVIFLDEPTVNMPLRYPIRIRNVTVSKCEEQCNNNKNNNNNNNNNNRRC
jgi:ABC-type uncharacterized transport system ATPase subunit